MGRKEWVPKVERFGSGEEEQPWLPEVESFGSDDRVTGERLRWRREEEESISGDFFVSFLFFFS